MLPCSLQSPNYLHNPLSSVITSDPQLPPKKALGIRASASVEVDSAPPASFLTLILSSAAGLHKHSCISSPPVANSPRRYSAFFLFWLKISPRLSWASAGGVLTLSCWSFLFLKFIYLFIYFYFWLCWVFISVRGLSLVAASGGHSSSRCAGLFTIAASLIVEHRLQTRRLSSCGSRAQLLRGMWDLPRPWLEPVSLALAGGFLTTAPPGKPWSFLRML